MSEPCFRFANYATPLRVIPSARSGRFHRSGDPVTQYFAEHPLGAWAEFLRWSPTTPATLPTVAVRLWVVRVELAQLVVIDFANASSWGISPGQLVSDDDYSDCQDLADRLRARGAPGVLVPSAALPGTRNVVLFGRYVLGPYGQTPMTPEHLSGTMVADYARPPEEVLPLYRPRNQPHGGLEAHARGDTFLLPEPATFSFA